MTLRIRPTILFLAFAYFVCTTSISSADDPVKQIGSAKTSASLVKLYVHLHQNPELSFEESETATRFAQELEAVGCEVTKNVGGHGVVGMLRHGQGPTVLVRTDLDGLPVTEATNLAYASKKVVTDSNRKQVGVMHACGHDVHMTNLIGVASGTLPRIEINGQARSCSLVSPRRSVAQEHERCWTTACTNDLGTRLRAGVALQFDDSNRNCLDTQRLRDGQRGQRRHRVIWSRRARRLSTHHHRPHRSSSQIDPGSANHRLA